MNLRRRPTNNHTHASRKSSSKIDFPKKDRMSTVTGLTVLVYFIGTVILITIYPNYVLNFFQLFQFFCFFLALSFFIPIKAYRKKLNMSYYEYVFVNFIGIAPLLLLLMLGLNSMHKSAPYTETYKIINSTSSAGELTFVLEGLKYDEYNNIRTIDINRDLVIEGNNYLSIQFTDGLLGIRLIENRRIH